MFGLNKKSNKNTTIKMPVDGTIIDLEQVNDPVFSQKLMGDGFAIEPTSNDIYAPINGEVISVFPHAIGIKAEDGLEVLVHVGIDTVNLGGEGFNMHVNQGDKVNAGDLVITADMAYLKDHAPAITTPVIFTDLAGHNFSINSRDVKALDEEAVTLS